MNSLVNVTHVKMMAVLSATSAPLSASNVKKAFSSTRIVDCVSPVVGTAHIVNHIQHVSSATHMSLRCQE